jgi:undecaprenyl-diphosphatase
MANLFRGRGYWLAGVAALLMVVGFGLLAEEAIEGDLAPFDRAAILALRTAGNPADPLGPPWFEEAARDVTALGSFTVLGLFVAIISGYLILTGHARRGWFLALMSLGGALLSTVLKSLFNLPRPDFEVTTRVFTASFPSGHATASAAVYLTIGGLLAARAAGRGEQAFYLTVAALLVVLVGLSRIYLGVHYPSDVLAGWLIGAGWALACIVVERLWRYT